MWNCQINSDNIRFLSINGGANWKKKGVQESGYKTVQKIQVT